MEDEEEVEEEDEDEEDDHDEDNAKEPRTLGQGEMVKKPAGAHDPMVDDQPIMLPEQDQEIRKHTPPPQPPVRAPQPRTPDPRQ